VTSAEVKYRLHESALQSGTLFDGHYTAFVRGGVKFFHINDAEVAEKVFGDWAKGKVWEGFDPQVHGYLFFYKRI
jgi:ubiquitin C-terminal hydrolase